MPKIRFYLRHTCATLLLSQGIHSKLVQEFLGHATIVMTLDTYSRSLPSIEDQARGRWEALWDERVTVTKGQNRI